MHKILQNISILVHGSKKTQNTSHDRLETSYLLIFFIICSRAPSHHYAGSLSICGNRFKLRNITLEKETFKHIDLITHITFLPLNQFSNWRNKTLTSHSWSWAGEFELITIFKKALYIESGHFSQKLHSSDLSLRAVLCQRINKFF